ncbi:MAG: PH domain-containing protein, partial [Saprospiraceae bacterium]|nr:PH domain-containing protein [Saprospiraceae bacterium]
GTVLLTILSAGIALLILSFFSSLIVTLFRFFNLRFLRTEAGFKIVAGLFNRREQAANLQKVQYIRWTINPIGRLFGLFSLRLLQASSQSVNRKESLNIPGCRFEQVARIRETYFPGGSELPSQEQPISPWFVRRRFLWLGIVPVAVLLGINALRGDLNWESAWPLLWLLPAWWLSRQAYRNWRLHLNERGVLIESGVFGRTFISLLWHKVQSVQLRQSLFQRRRNVADLILFTAAGSVRIPYLPLSAARKMRDYLVYYVESSRLAWM